MKKRFASAFQRVGSKHNEMHRKTMWDNIHAFCKELINDIKCRDSCLQGS